MPRTFSVPQYYRSSGIGRIKQLRDEQDPRRRDLSPTLIDFGPVRFKLARRFGFCFGVENAIEIAYRAVEENPGKRVFLVSEMIHNPEVNKDLISRGVGFLATTNGETLFPLEALTPADIVVVPAFGASLEIIAKLKMQGIDPCRYDTTCPFVEKVWRKASDLGRQGFTVIIHGKRRHEETQATFSHSKEEAPTLVIRDYEDAEFLASFLLDRVTRAKFEERFSGAVSPQFDPARDLVRIGVVNQTTMLASETLRIADLLRETMAARYGLDGVGEHFADTRDTLCYATHENQESTISLIESGADLAVVVGGYNSSNTSHLVELCMRSMPTYFIQDAGELLERELIRSFMLESRETVLTRNWLPDEPDPVTVAITSGASCPDATVDSVIRRICEFFPKATPFEKWFEPSA